MSNGRRGCGGCLDRTDELYMATVCPCGRMLPLAVPELGDAASGTLLHERDRPEQATLYRLMQQHAGFVAHTEASTGSELPRFSKDEFDAFLE